MNPLLEAIADGWSWKLGRPVELIATNPFGNAIVRTEAGHYYRITPEEWSCELIAESAAELGIKRAEPDFMRDWAMARLCALAQATQGPLGEGQVYCLVQSGVVGGKYEADNIRKVSLRESLSYSGSMAKQIDELPDGTQIRIKVRE